MNNQVRELDVLFYVFAYIYHEKINRSKKRKNLMLKDVLYTRYKNLKDSCSKKFDKNFILI